LKTPFTAKPMTIERANEITNGIEAVLATPQLVGRQFKPISRTGASTRLEMAHALYIVTAQVFKSVSALPGRAAEFTAFARAVGSSLFHVLWLQPCLPDSELHLIAKLHEENKEFWTESLRLSEFAQNDGTMKLETIESFVLYLGTLNPDEVDYWPKVYQHIGLDCPIEISGSHT